MKKAHWVLVAAVAVAAWLVLDLVVTRRPTPVVSDEGGGPSAMIAESDRTTLEAREVEAEPDEGSGGEEAEDEEETSEEEEPMTDEERREAEEEKRVDAFDNLTDRWMEPSEKGVSMADIDQFAAAFRAIPAARRDECVHRALNLVPDENVMLLAGILMDKSMDGETVETVFNDVLNRDEDVKKPILEQIFKDKSHPCWADTAWILDVTGELPGRQEESE